MNVSSPIEQWEQEAQELASLVENLPSRLLDLSTVPPCNDPQALLGPLLAARRAFSLASPNSSLNPVGDRVALAPENLKHPLASLYQAIEYSILRCVAAGARDPSIICAADFGTGLGAVVVPSSLPRIVLGELRALGEQHPVRRALPLVDGYRPTAGNPSVVLGPVVGGGFPGDPLPLRLGAWWDLTEAIATTRRWRHDQLSREAQAQADQERERIERADREAAWRAGDRSSLKPAAQGR
jgi:hypothetical protein